MSGHNTGLPPVVRVISFGFKRGTPAASVVLDARWLPNPFHHPDFHDLSGLDAPVQRYLTTRDGAEAWLDNALGVIAPLVRSARQTGRAVIVAVGCTAGHDRSVGIAEVLANRLPAIDFAMEVSLRHRDLHYRGGRDPMSPQHRSGSPSTGMVPAQHELGQR